MGLFCSRSVLEDTLVLAVSHPPDHRCHRLSLSWLPPLEADIKEAGLPATCGFFFGASDGTETEDDLAFIAKAREKVKKGYTVFYDSWW